MKKSDKKLFIITSSLIIAFLFCIKIISVYDNYQILRHTSPLALFEILFPIYSVLIIILIITSIINIYYKIEDRYIHILLLTELAIMFWITPQYLSGFSRTGDSLWHTGISSQIPYILKEISNFRGWHAYSEQYPISFILNYVIMEITNINIFMYQQLFYPTLCAFIFIFFFYIFVCRFFDPNVGFISCLFVLFFMVDFPEIHPSPHSLGTIYVLISLILLVTKINLKNKILGFLTASICTLTHPISPIILILFLITDYIINIFIPNFKNKISIFGILFLVIMWYSWVYLYSIRIGQQIIDIINNFLNPTISYNIDKIVKKGTSTTWFLYPKINLLNKIVRYGFIIIAIILFYYRIKILYREKSIRKLLKQIKINFEYNEILIISISAAYLVLSLLIEMSGIFPGMIERSYFYFILLTSTYIGFELLNFKSEQKKYIIIFVFICFTLLSMINPLIIYSDESGIQYPSSEGFGLKFIASHIDLSKNSISMSNPRQIFSFISFRTPWTPTQFYLKNSTFSSSTLYPWHGTIEEPPEIYPDVIVLRGNQYFMIILRYDLSFTHNRYLSAFRQLEQNTLYNKIYQSQTFSIFIK